MIPKQLKTPINIADQISIEIIPPNALIDFTHRASPDAAKAVRIDECA